MLKFMELRRTYCKEACKKVFPSALFMAVTYGIYTPSALFLNNIDEFVLHYIYIVPSLVAVTLVLFIVIYGLALCVTNERNIKYFVTFVFAVALGLYIQSNFLNPKFSLLDGTRIDWSLYRKENLISIIFWCLCIVLLLVFTFLWEEKMEHIIKYAAFFLAAVQMVSLPVLIFTNHLDESAHYALKDEGEFSLGREKNIILFVVDTLEADTMEEYLQSSAYPAGSLNDFTFFDNAVSGGAPTVEGLALLLTGVERDPNQSWDEYMSEIWEDTSLYEDFHNNNYDVRFYTNNRYLHGLSDGKVDNYAYDGPAGIADYTGFTRKLYRLTNFYVMPQCIKEYFWLYTDEFFPVLKYSSEDNYEYNDIMFYSELRDRDELLCEYENAFRMYHFSGVHQPYKTNEELEQVEEGSVTEQQVLCGEMKILYEYIEKMKEAGVYDASTIIITGDHGRPGENIADNPAILVKRAYDTHELVRDSAPIHFRNVVATMAEAVMDDYAAYGPSVFDITEESDVERLHLLDAYLASMITIDEEYDASLGGVRFVVVGNAQEDEYHVWNPKHINRINYTIGEKIDFTTDNMYAEELDYRLYKDARSGENGRRGATASNELNICFELVNYQQEELKLHFVCSDVYNEAQKVRIYAGGNKVTNIVCTQDDAGKENIVTIPGEYIEDNILTLRMVFPGAVTPRQLDENNPDTRVLSVTFDSMWLE